MSLTQPSLGAAGDDGRSVMGTLTESLRGIIEGPLGEHGVSRSVVAERVAAIRQHERHRVFGVSIFRDGEDRYFIGEEAEPVDKKMAAEAVRGALQANRRLLDDDGEPVDETLSVAALKAIQDQEKVAQDFEAKIGEVFKKIGKRYVDALRKMTGKEWRVSSASRDIFSLDSEDEQAIDIYWEFDPGSETATIYIEGPKGKREVYKKQRLADIPKKNYVAWLQRTLGEEMKAILGVVMMEMASPEGVFENAIIIEEVEGILSEFEVYRKQSFGEVPIRAGEKPQKIPTVATKSNVLFRRLLVALKSGGDYENIIWLLRKEGVPENDISFAIRRLRIPRAYAEAEDKEVESLPFDADPHPLGELTGEGGRWEGGGTFQQWAKRGGGAKSMEKVAAEKGYAELTWASTPRDFLFVGKIAGDFLKMRRIAFVLDDARSLQNKKNLDSFSLGVHLGLGEGPAVEPKDKTKWDMKWTSGHVGKGWSLRVVTPGTQRLPSKAVVPKGLGAPAGPKPSVTSTVATEPKDTDFTKTQVLPKAKIWFAS